MLAAHMDEVGMLDLRDLEAALKLLVSVVANLKEAPLMAENSSG